MSNVCFPTSILIHFGPFPKSLAGSQPFKPSRARFPPKKKRCHSDACGTSNKEKPSTSSKALLSPQGWSVGFRNLHVGLAIHRNSQGSINLDLHHPNVHRPFSPPATRHHHRILRQETAQSTQQGLSLAWRAAAELLKIR